MCTQFKGLWIGVLVLGVALLVGLGLFQTLGAKSTQLAERDVELPLKVELKLARLPDLGTPVELQATVKAAEDAPGTTVQITLPDGVRLASGSLTWQGDLRANGSADFSATIVFDQYGEYELTASARSPIDANNTRLGSGATAVRIGAQKSEMGLATMNIGQQQLVVIPGGIVPMQEPDRSQYGVSPAPQSAQGCGSVRAYGWAYFRDSTNTNWVPATNVNVELWDHDSWSGDDYEGYAYVDANGYWSIGPVSQDDEWWTCGLDLYYKLMYDGAWARVENSSSNLYVWQSGVANNVPDGTHNFGSGGIPYSLEEFRARNIYFTARRAWLALITRAGVPAARATVQYRHSDTDSQTWAHYNNGGKVYLPGVGYDWSNYGTQKVELHELGHHYQYELYGRWLPNPYCPSPHYVNGASSDNCGWLEGWATFVALYVNQDPTAYGYNYESLPACGASFPCAANVEGRVTGSLWDLYDSGDEVNYDYYAAGTSGGRSKVFDTIYSGGHQSTFWQYWGAYKNRYPKYSASRDPCFGVASIHQTGGIWFDYGPTMAYMPDQYMVKNTTKYVDLWPYADDAECPDSSMTYVVDYASNPSVGASATTDGFLRLQPATNWTGWSQIRVWVGDGPTWARVMSWAPRYVWVYVSNTAEDIEGVRRPSAPSGGLPLPLAMQNGRPVPLTEASTEISAAFGRPASPAEPTPTGMPIPIDTPTSAPGTPEPGHTPEPPPSTSEPTSVAPTDTPTATSTPAPPDTTPTPGTFPTDLPTATATDTPTAFPTSFPPTPTPEPPALSINPSTVSLKQHETSSFTVENGAGPYTWYGTGGVITPGQYLNYWLFQIDQSGTAMFEAGDQRGDFAVTVSDSTGKQAFAHVLVGGLEITTKPEGQPLHINVGDTLTFQVDDVSAASRGPFLWILDGGGPTTAVGTIQAQAGGVEGLFTALGNGTAIVTAYGTDPNGKVVNSNSMLVIVGNTLEIPDVKGVPGQEATVRINLNNISIRPVSNFQMTLLFPSNLLTFKSVKPSFRAANFTVGSNLIASGKLNIIMTSLTGETILPGQGPILDLRFDVAPAASGTGSLSFEAGSVIVLDNQVPPQDIPVQAKGGTFTVVSASSLAHDGDINHDGKVNIKDLALAISIFLDRYAPSTAEFAAADISPLTTGDGVVDVTDVLKVFNKALGKPITQAALRPQQSVGSIVVRMPAQITARAGEVLLLPIDLSNPSDAIGGMNLTIVYTATTGVYTPTLDIASRAQNMHSDINAGVTGQTKFILYTPDTVQTIGAGSGNVATLDLGIVDQNVWVTVGVMGSALSDASGNALAHTVELYSTSTPSDDFNRVYLPIVIKNR